MGLQKSSSLDGVTQQRLLIRAGDRLPALAFAIEDDTGQPVDLSGLLVYLSSRRLSLGSGPLLPSAQMRVENAATGLVSYDWQPGDTSVTPGVYEIRVAIRSSDGVLVRSVPSVHAQGVVDVRSAVSTV